MGTFYGINPRLVTTSDVSSITLNNMVIDYDNTGNIGLNGSYQLKTTNAGVGCGSTGVYLELNDNINWMNISYEVLMTGTASCWSFNVDGYGPSPGTGYLLAYDETAGDLVMRCLNTWEIPAYQSHGKTSACDNDASNFFRFEPSPYKSLFMKRRRNWTGSNKGGINLGRACAGEGTTIIRNIRIWV